RPGQEDRIDEPEGLDDSRNERPRREEERDRADAHPERAPPRQRGAPQAPLHHLGDGRQQGRLDRASLLLPRIVGGIDVRDSGRAEAVDLDDRLFFRPGEVRGLGARDEEAAWRKRLALRLAQLRTVAGVERSGDDGHVLVDGMRVSRHLVVGRELQPVSESSRLRGVAFQHRDLHAWRQGCRSTASAQSPSMPGMPSMPAGMVMLTPDEMKWGDGPAALPPGVKIAMLEGNPAQPGAFAYRLKFPANYKVPAHTHPADEHVTVISGTFYAG